MLSFFRYQKSTKKLACNVGPVATQASLRPSSVHSSTHPPGCWTCTAVGDAVASASCTSCASCTNCIPRPSRDGSRAAPMSRAQMCRRSRSGRPPSYRSVQLRRPYPSNQTRLCRLTRCAYRPPEPSARSGLSTPSAPIVSGKASKPPSRAVALLGEVDGVQVRILLDAKVVDEGCVLVSAVDSAKRWMVAARSIACLRFDVSERPAG